MPRPRLRDPLGDPQDEPEPHLSVQIRMTPTQRKTFTAAARRYDMTLAAWIRAIAIDAVRQDRAPFVQENK